MAILLVSYLAYRLLSDDGKTIFMPGDLTSGHHQIGIVCDACHTDSFTNKDDMQKACVNCHGDQRVKPFDSHPADKFTDPRNTDRLENINALYCVTCHVEHKPEITQKTGLTQPKDFCIHCHEDVAEERPSHAGMKYDTCASAGCHNYHNNRALYTDFLVKHAGEPDLLKKRRMPAREFGEVLDDLATYPHAKFPVKTVHEGDISDIAQKYATENIKHDWMTTAHAKIGATCESCHSTKTSVWEEKPGSDACKQCHNVEVKHFMQGKHGMRLQQKLSPMAPAMSRLPMKEKSLDKELTCNTCHQAHLYKLQRSAVDVCLDCHDDKHSLAYKSSPHFQLWEQEQKGELAESEGVSCATCHMPRTSIDVSDWLRRVVVQHNQNATLVPNEKMLRPVCMQCHGLGFSIDALADERLIEKNFKGRPEIHVQSIDMADRDNKRHQQKTGGE